MLRDVSWALDARKYMFASVKCIRIPFDIGFRSALPLLGLIRWKNGLEFITFVLELELS